jgi:hypothetical protein
MLGKPSAYWLLTGAPGLLGIPKGAETLARVVNQISPLPSPPGREGSVSKYSDKPSFEMLGAPSSPGLLTVEPRLPGAVKDAEGVGRVAIQMSPPPDLPSRSEM